MPLHIAILLSLVLHLVGYTLADWAGWRAPPAPPPREIIEALLILPGMSVPAVPELPPPAAVPPAPTLPAAVPALPAAPRPAVAPASAVAQAALAPLRPADAVPPPLYYPPEAVARGLEGEALVTVSLDASGSVTAARLERGSGHAILDEAALRAARTLRGLPGGRGEASLPVRFRLK